MKVGLSSETDWREAIEDLRACGAELICLPQLSFVPYVAASRDRAGLEMAERSPSRTLEEALQIADGAWLAASAYESEGEGVFYVTSYLAGPKGERASYRQRVVEAAQQRYEQMFWSPGHLPNATLELPIGTATTLVGADLRDPDAWARVAEQGVRVVLGGASEPAEIWLRTQRVAAGMAATYRIAALVVNRTDDHNRAVHPGGIAAFGSDGDELAATANGLYEIGVQ